MSKLTKYCLTALLFFSIGPSIPAVSGNTPKDSNPNTYVTHLLVGFLLHRTVTIANNAHAWVAAHLGLLEEKPEDIPLDENDLPNAQIALNEILERGEEHNGRMEILMTRLRAKNVPTLLRVIVTPTIAPDVRFLATTVLRNEHILPRLAEGRYAEIGAINRHFLAVADTGNEDHRQTARRVFAFAHPDPNVQLEEPTLVAYLEIHRGNTDFRNAVETWFKNTSLRARGRRATQAIIIENPALEEVQLRVIALIEEIRGTPHKDKERTVALLHELHAVIRLFESLEAESASSLLPKAKKRPVNSHIRETLDGVTSERFALSGDYEVDALLLGFEKDHGLVSAAEALDVSDKKHRISKGDSFIRGGLIISRDIDSHAGSAYKLHAMTGKNRWEYLDTVVLTQVGEEWMFLLLNRNKRYSEDYWFLVTADGKWYRIDKRLENARPEAVIGPQTKESRARRAPEHARRREHNGRA